MLFDASFTDGTWPAQSWSARLTYGELIARLPFLASLIPVAGLARLSQFSLELEEDGCHYKVALVK